MDLMALFQPEVLLPQQLTRRDSQFTGELELAYALLTQAVDTLRGKYWTSLSDFEADYDWVTCESDEFFSFNYLCDVFGLNAVSLRQKLVAAARDTEARRPTVKKRAVQVSPIIRGDVRVCIGCGKECPVDWSRRRMKFCSKACRMASVHSWPHGTKHCYQWYRCRCDLCMVASRAYREELKARKLQFASSGD